MAFLVLEDGTVFSGRLISGEGSVTGEVVFNTGMTGYQEILTDPSYFGQIVTMTYPLIGNYGINSEDFQSAKPQVRGFVMRELCEYPSNWLKSGDLAGFLRKNNILAIDGVDTRALTRRIREHGAMMGMISVDLPTQYDIEDLKNRQIVGHVGHVTTDHVYCLPGDGPHIAVIDFGIKDNIIQSLRKRGCMITVFPASTSSMRILQNRPDGILLSNGPGDPKENTAAIAAIKEMIGKKPIFGICLGHQLLALATGADTSKLRFGHRGLNHPVKDLRTGRVYITSQNHGYAVFQESIDKEQVEITQINLNDGTVEGLRLKNAPAFSVQYHPEAMPGPEDTNYLFDEFLSLVGGE